jgi:Big-like domain-containing protein
MSPRRFRIPLHTASRQPGRAVVACVLPLVLSACESLPEPTRVATTIAVTPSTAVSLAAIGATQQLTAVVKDQSGDTLASAGVTWATSSVAEGDVSATGLATAVGDGSAQIMATSGSATT